MILGEAFIYLMKVNIALVVFYLFYRLLFSRDTFFMIRRGCLWMILGMSFIYPLILFSFGEEQKEAIQQTVVRYAVNLLPEVKVTPEGQSVAITGWDIVRWGYCTIVCLLLARIVIQIYSIVRLVRKGERAFCCSVPVIVLPGQVTPFSFFKWIFVNPSGYDTRDLQEIMVHEKTHADQYHSLDVMVSEVLCSFFWMNPAAWLLKREIRRNLEFLADKRVVHSGFDRRAYQYHLLRLSHPSAAAQIVNKFNVTPLKKRIIMMNKKRTSRMGLIKYALLVPVLGLLVLSSNVQAIVHQDNGTMLLAGQDSVLVKGVVVDSNDVPLDGATVIVKGTNVGVSTDGKGEFAIKVKTGETLIFSYVGKANQFIPVKDAKKLHVKMLTENVVLDELVVVGYSGDAEEADVFMVVEDMPQFMGEDGNVMKFLAKRIRYPQEAQKSKIQGKVFVQFIISKTGEAKDFKVIKSVHPLLDREAIRVLQLMPNWKPGTQRGKPVSVSYTVPINFQLQ
ncbi:M56 family metallopeptidase [Butyricimonas paravirosa]|uniref:M56 family metallopeptidase n=1 Tax=Butyricimonas paravirosa TaxID=1472417 RepID=UPI00210BCB6B|nr:M56 family metallopeptidase [Butyricimonas paravirosa]MCQ4871944.1 TonB family protein [Butyricimonas paravirosa]